MRGGAHGKGLKEGWRIWPEAVSKGCAEVAQPAGFKRGVGLRRDGLRSRGQGYRPTLAPVLLKSVIAEIGRTCEKAEARAAGDSL